MSGYQFRLARINRGEFLQGFVHREQLVVIRGGRRYFESIQVNNLDARPPFFRQPPPGVLDQNAAHRLGCRSEKMGAVLKRRRLITAQPHPGFVDEGGRLERMTGGFVRHFLCRQPAEFFIDNGEQLSGRLGIALSHPFQDMRELIHLPRIETCLPATTSNHPKFDR